MKNKINKYLFYSGISILVLFFITVGIIKSNEKEMPYTLTIYGKNPEEHLKEIKDSNQLINWYGYNDMDERIKLNTGTHFVLFKKKNKEIILIAENAETINKYLEEKGK